MKQPLIIFIRILAILVVLFTIIPFFASEAWFVRILDFPKIQVFFIGIVLVSLFIYHYIKRKKDVFLLTTLILVIIYHAFILFPFTPFAATNAKDITTPSSDKQIKMVIANVYMENRAYEEFLDMIEEIKPDLFLTLETDIHWQHVLDSFGTKYPFTVKIPKDNTYGMHLYSKYSLAQTDVKYWLDKEVPSIRTLVVIPSGDTIELFGVHPKPPVPTEDDDSKQRDAEIIIVGNRASKSKYPVIVAGDFNDVAWSQTTNLFREVSGLLDPRIGRGFYNTYHARIPLVKWSLDHVFFSPHFKLVSLAKLPDIKSDHYPLSIEISLQPEEMKDHSPVKKDSATQKKETETIEEGIENAKEEEE